MRRDQVTGGESNLCLHVSECSIDTIEVIKKINVKQKSQMIFKFSFDACQYSERLV